MDHYDDSFVSGEQLSSSSLSHSTTRPATLDLGSGEAREEKALCTPGIDSGFVTSPEASARITTNRFFQDDDDEIIEAEMTQDSEITVSRRESRTTTGMQFVQCTTCLRQLSLGELCERLEELKKLAQNEDDLLTVDNEQDSGLIEEVDEEVFRPVQLMVPENSSILRRRRQRTLSEYRESSSALGDEPMPDVVPRPRRTQSFHDADHQYITMVGQRLRHISINFERRQQRVLPRRSQSFIESLVTRLTRHV